MRKQQEREVRGTRLIFCPTSYQNGTKSSRRAAAHGPIMARKQRITGSWRQLADIGWDFVGALAVFGFIGWWIDERYETQPVALLVCLILGIVGASYNVIRRALAVAKKDEQERKASATKPMEEPKRD